MVVCWAYVWDQNFLPFIFRVYYMPFPESILNNQFKEVVCWVYVWDQNFLPMGIIINHYEDP